ncbi:MAG: STAS domain-containing protein [Chloroflexi bacterium]|nr:STAS domain-containing protein [Chloroflexota bacterium]
MLEITSEKHGCCDLVKATGRIDKYTVVQLKDAFDAISQAGRFEIVFDMGAVSFIDSSGLAVMVRTAGTCRQSGGRLVLAAVVPMIRNVLELSHITGEPHRSVVTGETIPPILKIYDTPGEAIDSFDSFY